jgi:hypothetical protein
VVNSHLKKPLYGHFHNPRHPATAPSRATRTFSLSLTSPGIEHFSDLIDGYGMLTKTLLDVHIQIKGVIAIAAKNTLERAVDSIAKVCFFLFASRESL